MSHFKLFMLLLGCKPPGRHTEQHDVFFGIAESLKDLVPEINAFWPEPDKIHIDAWRQVSVLDGFRIKILQKNKNKEQPTSAHKLFFVNLGGYLPNKFEEQHYYVLTVQQDRAAAFKAAKETAFFKHKNFKGAASHIDDKYGIDIDDLYQIEEILSPSQKEKYQIELVPTDEQPEPEFHLGYLKLSQLDQ